ncbi:MAG TPA: hypothetical protein EYP62_06060 [Kiritimatiellae bacterium]|nr:hypothetical protein [Kiritimatiellia bacterium]
MSMGWTGCFLLPTTATLGVILGLWAFYGLRAPRRHRPHSRDVFHCDICGQVYVADTGAELMVPCPRCGMMNEPIRR